MRSLYKLKKYLENNISNVGTYKEMYLLCSYCAEDVNKKMVDNQRKYNAENPLIAKNYKASLDRKKKELERIEAAIKYIAETGKCPCNPLGKCPCIPFQTKRICNCGVFKCLD